VSAPNPTIRVALDPTNPGQFFACCGLLELADRLWAGAEGWFDFNPTAFYLRVTGQNVDASPATLIGELGRCRLANTMTEEQVRRLDELSDMKAKEREKAPGLDGEKKALERLWREAPIVLYAPFDLQIDWFLDDRAGGSRFKTWAGQQSVIDIATAMMRPIADGRWSGVSPDQWLGLPAGDDSLPFNFDSDLGGQASAIDVGFSMDPLKSIDPVRMRIRTRPLVELGAFVGLQRFRPFAVPGENRYQFWLWPDPLPPEVACAVACGMVSLPGSQGYEFRLLYRTKYLKSFLPAIPTRGDA
jgi:CRISPR-associated protein Csb3